MPGSAFPSVTFAGMTAVSYFIGSVYAAAPENPQTGNNVLIVRQTMTGRPCRCKLIGPMPTHDPVAGLKGKPLAVESGDAEPARLGAGERLLSAWIGGSVSPILGFTW